MRVDDTPLGGDLRFAAAKGRAVRVVAALSGGVDSAVAAARAVEAGQEVLGVHLVLGAGSPSETPAAAEVARQLGIDFEVWDLSEAFRHEVIDYFVGEYAAGRTPNPCLRCNRTLKFGDLLRMARQRGFDAVLTGHYARLRAGMDGEPQLRRARDLRKDQSYVLGVLGPEQLSHSMLVLGEDTKPAVRAEAAARGLSVASKADSQDICFLSHGGMAEFLDARLRDQPGDIVDTRGQVIGQHRGHFHYTIGQRNGLGLGRPAADGRPRYVVGIEAARNLVVVGQESDLLAGSVDLQDLTWTTRHPPTAPWEGVGQYRAHGRPRPIRLAPRADGGLHVDFTEPVPSLAPGQFLVHYLADRVLGSGVITRVSHWNDSRTHSVSGAG